MTRTVAPLLMVIVGFVVFVMVADPMYKQALAIQKEAEQYHNALDRATELEAVRDNLLSTYNTFKTEDLNRLEKLLPDTVDNVRLVLEINNIAAQYGMQLENIGLSEQEDTTTTVQGGDGAGNQAVGGPLDELSSVSLEFSVSASYSNFLRFIGDLEHNLRLVEIDTIDLVTRDDVTDFADYQVKVNTYWFPEDAFDRRNTGQEQLDFGNEPVS